MSRLGPKRFLTAEVIRSWAPVIFWMGCILVASGDSFSYGHTAPWLSVLLDFVSVVPADYFDTIHLIVRKTAHVVEYGLLGFLAYRAFQCTWPSSAVDRRVLGTMALVLACATLDETRQSFVASRTGAPWDVLLDAMGAWGGIYVFRLFAPAGEYRPHLRSLSALGPGGRTCSRWSRMENAEGRSEWENGE